MNLNNIKTGIKLIKEIIATSKSNQAPWHKKNQVDSATKIASIKKDKKVK